jgi:hypothetical protein
MGSSNIVDVWIIHLDIVHLRVRIDPSQQLLLQSQRLISAFIEDSQTKNEFAR